MKLLFCTTQAALPTRQDTILGAHQVFSGLPAGVMQNPAMLAGMAPWQQQRIGGTTITTFLPGTTMDLSLLANTRPKPTLSLPAAHLPAAHLPAANMRSVVSDALTKYAEQAASRSPQQHR